MKIGITWGETVLRKAVVEISDEYIKDGVESEAIWAARSRAWREAQLAGEVPTYQHGITDQAEWGKVLQRWHKSEKYLNADITDEDRHAARHVFLERAAMESVLEEPTVQPVITFQLDREVLQTIELDTAHCEDCGSPLKPEDFLLQDPRPSDSPDSASWIYPTEDEEGN